MLGTGAALAIIRRSSTPCSLAKTGGSTNSPAEAATGIQTSDATAAVIQRPDLISENFGMRTRTNKRRAIETDGDLQATIEMNARKAFIVTSRTINRYCYRYVSRRLRAALSWSKSYGIGTPADLALLARLPVLRRAGETRPFDASAHL